MIELKGSTILPIILLLLVILAIVFGKHVFTKMSNSEHFSSENCMYLPWGPTVDSCSTNCMSNDRVGLWDIDGNQCNPNVCDKICATCVDESRCQGVNTWSKEQLEKLRPKTKNKLSKLLPKKLNISGISYPDTASSTSFDGLANIKLFWQNYGDADSFMIHYFDMTATEDFIKVKTLDTSSANEYELTKLKPNRDYSVVVYSINDYGVSDASNIIIVKT